MTKTILIVDDSKFTRKMVALPLGQDGREVISAEGPNQALEKIKDRQPDLIISDLKMPTLVDGLGFLKVLALEHPDIPVLVYSADPNPKDTVGETGLRYIKFLQKPVAPDVLRQEIDMAFA